jgi:DNA polymerase-3 subunit alpha
LENSIQVSEDKLWKLIEPFAAYGFNKAHAASYGRVAYQTAYMKANYPVEYMSAVLTADSGDVEKISEIIHECERMGIEVLPPDINESFADFSVNSFEFKFFTRYAVGAPSILSATIWSHYHQKLWRSYCRSDY